MPMAIATTRICSTLNDIATLPSSPAAALEAEHVGRHQAGEEVEPGAGASTARAAASAATLVWSPGWSTRPSTMPIETAISAVMANQTSVFQARRAAPVTSRRLAMEATIARKTSGGTTARSSVTKVPPMVLRVSVSQLGSTSPVAASTPSAPMLRATRPRTTPSTSPVRTCTPNEGRRKRAGFVGLRNRSIHTEKITFRSGTARTRGRGRREVSRRRGRSDTGRSRCARGRRLDAASAGRRRSWECSRPATTGASPHGFRGSRHTSERA